MGATTTATESQRSARARALALALAARPCRRPPPPTMPPTSLRCAAARPSAGRGRKFAAVVLVRGSDWGLVLMPKQQRKTQVSVALRHGHDAYRVMARSGSVIAKAAARVPHALLIHSWSCAHSSRRSGRYTMTMHACAALVGVCIIEECGDAGSDRPCDVWHTQTKKAPTCGFSCARARPGQHLPTRLLATAPRRQFMMNPSSGCGGSRCCKGRPAG